MATGTWDEIHAGSYEEKSKRNRFLRAALLLWLPLACVFYTAFNIGAHEEQKEIAAVEWNGSRQDIWMDYFNLGTAASESDEHAYRLLLTSGWRSTAALERELLEMREWHDPAKRNVIEAAHRCMPASMAKFNARSPEERDFCTKNLQPPR